MKPADFPSHDPVLSLRGVSKRFGSLWANRDISLDIRAGEVLAVVGENGAGKSTLMNLLYGRLQPDSGEIHVHGRRVRFSHPRQALAAGIGMVHQELQIFPQLTVLENIVAGSTQSRSPWVRHRERAMEIGSLCSNFGFDLPLEGTAGELPFARRQEIEILRALYRDARILILDEPTSLLAPPEVEKLFRFLGSLRTQGRTILLISHRLSEVFALADRIGILRRGRLIGTYPVEEVSREEIAGRMIADSSIREPKADVPSADRFPLESEERDTGIPLLRLQNLHTPSWSRDAGIRELSLEVYPGEILGVGGVVGNGQRSLAAAVAGIGPISRGRLFLEGVEFTRSSIAERLEMGIRRLSANPPEETFAPHRSLWENLLLGFQRRPAHRKGGLLRKAEILRWTIERLEEYEAVYSNPRKPLSTLSGGNRQKAALAHAFAGTPRLLILEQPGRGLDVHSQERLHRRIRAMSSRGVSFLFFSYDLDELLSVSHRIAVLYRGRLAGIVSRRDASLQLLSRWMFGLPTSDGEDLRSREGPLQ
ncbi:MAG TPA: ATP-binding cassette domain-containing protein [Syntrophobacteraceae bacterium]|nr:ATP-binding cassette domain-containing protein [Syntrophobacteraceae bacterium]